MNEPREPELDDRSSDEHLRHDADRRDFLRGALGVGVFALGGGTALGHSLLLRAMVPAPIGDSGNPTTLTIARWSTYSQTGSVPPTKTYSGVETPPQPPGTFTLSAPAPKTTSITSSHTNTWPGPGGTTQTVTIAGTSILSYTPPATNYQTASWRGNSWWITNFRTPPSWSVTVTESFSLSYTSTTTAGNHCPEEQPAPDSIELARNARDGALVESIDALDFDVRDTQSRTSHPRIVKLACGVDR